MSGTKMPWVALQPRVQGLPLSATLAINERSHALQQAGRQIYKLGLGQSPFPVPPSVVAALQAHAAEKDYLPVRGLPALRAAVAAYHERQDALGRTADEVLIGPGSKELMYLLQTGFAGPLVLPTPCWVSYAPQARLAGQPVQYLPTRRADGWRLTPAALDAFAQATAGTPRLLLLNYPSNPTGASYTADELAALAEVARRHRLVVLSDEIYGELHHTGAHVSMARCYPEGTIVSAGLSKWCGAGGWRLGTFSFPPSLRPLLDALAAAASETFTAVSAPIQYAAIRAYAGGPDIEAYLNGSRRLLHALGQHLAEQLRAAGAHLPDPDGAFYLFPDFSAHAEQLRARGIASSPAFAERLLEETGVALLPGVAFGHAPTTFTCRLAYVDFDGAEALARVAEAPPGRPLGEGVLRACCGAVLEAVDRLCDWVVGR